jgi:nicotinamidase-related amidase
MTQSRFTAPDYARAALISIDLQRDFLDNGPFAVTGTSAVIPAICRVVSCFRTRAQPIFHVVRLYEEDGSNLDVCRRHLVDDGSIPVRSGSAGSQLAPELLPSAATLNSAVLLKGSLQLLSTNEWALYKPRWGAFYQTSLEGHLRALGVSTLVFVGCNFPNCPRASIYEASERDFRVVAVTDAISGMYDRGVAELENIGVSVVTSDELAGDGSW